MATAVVVSASVGVMKPVLGKLATLMGEKFKKIKGLHDNVTMLQRELEEMDALVETIDRADKLDPQAINWKLDIIDMAYDIEDCIDDFMQRLGQTNNNVGILGKAVKYLRTFKDRCQLGDMLKDMRVQVIEASQRRSRYMFGQSIQITTPVYVDPRLSTIYKHSASLVGINAQKSKLVNWAMDKEQQLKVMAIVGFGGLGKTTLATEVLHHVGRKFSYKAFVSVSQKPNIVGLFNSLLSKLGLCTYSTAELAIIDLNEHLHAKRYLIVVDDLWGVEEWNIISRAFPQNNRRSRVIITTRDESVARACSNQYGGFIYKMKSLSNQDSRKLFLNRIFNSEVCPPEFTYYSDEILKKCSGLPLAIITIASILDCEGSSRSQWIDQWEFIKTSLAAQLPTNNPTLDGMMSILNLSYKNLPRDLKKCFLYLGIYPEDHAIGKTDLVRQWVAEGFVRQDMAESYFNKLVNMSMIQPEYDLPEYDLPEYDDPEYDDPEYDELEYDDDLPEYDDPEYDDPEYDELEYDEEGHTGEVIGCKVHDMMRDMILRKCAEENFISFLHDDREVAEPPRYKIRRLSVNWRGVEDCRIPIILSSHLSHLRCLTMFGTSECIPPLSEFKFLWVLFIEISKPGIRLDLTDISQLSLLKSLKVVTDVRCQISIVLPGQIWRLQHLKILELPLNSNCHIPSDVDDFPCLSHLNVPSSLALPKGIGKAKSLRTIIGFCLLESSSQSIEGLGQHTNMEELRINAEGRRYPRTDRWMAALSSSLDKLGNLKVLVILCCHNVHFCADAMSRCTPSRKLEQLNLYNLTFSRVPRWMRGLRYLRELWLGVMQLEQEDVDMIGTGLQSLVDLNLRIPGVTAERIVISDSTGFSVLKSLSLDWDGMSSLTFEAGAMPELQELNLKFTPQPQEWDVAIPAGLQHLSSLKIICPSTTRIIHSTTTRMIRRAFERACSHLPNQPDVCVDHARSGRGIEVRQDGEEI